MSNSAASKWKQPSSPLSLFSNWATILSENPSALEHLKRLADDWLEAPALSVANKRHPAPSRDAHDYVSMGPYWWPDPLRPDGLPYVRRDGEVNPQFYEYDSTALEALCFAVPHLVLYALGADSSRHAQQAGKLLWSWFLDPATRMNPHLNYAQFIPGITDGRPIGIIDTSSLVILIEATKYLPFNSEWTPAYLAALKGWFSNYLDWLLEGPFGPRERDELNNHGTWYDVQVASYAMFCDRPEVARQQIQSYTIPRILGQIEADGKQPRELARTLSLTYSTFNLLAFAFLALIARGLAIDLWTESGPAQGRLLKALEWLEPYYVGQQKWRGEQIHAFDTSSAAPLFYLAWLGTENTRFLKLCTPIEKQPWQRLIFSKSALTGRTYPLIKKQGT